MKTSFNALLSVLAVFGLFYAVTWLADGAPIAGAAGAYVNDAKSIVQSSGMSTQQMATAGLIIVILVWALSSLRPGKGGAK